MDARRQLEQWFTAYEVRLFFGARTRVELAELADTFERLSTGDREKMRRQLWADAYARGRVQRRVHRGKSIMGRLFVAASRELKP